jgi:phosphatidylethanolamine/phosphatidyl-N-methylethanolamine N-methyltransferase
MERENVSQRPEAAQERIFWEQKAKHYDGAMKLFRRSLPRTLELTVEAVTGADEVLEVAAGTGLFTAAIAPHVRRLVATDYAEAMLDVLGERMTAAGLSNVEQARADIYALDYPASAFDVVLASNVLHLVPDLVGALAALKRVLRPGGKLVAPTFCHDQTRVSWLLSRVFAVMGQPMHRRFTARSLQQAIEQAGFVVERAETVPGPIPIAFVQATSPSPIAA